MPEILTKHPDVVLQVLKSAGIACGSNAKPHILTHCPPNRFCALPKGELCVYDINTVASMTQMTPADLGEFAAKTPTIYSNINMILLIVSCLFGLIMGMLFK